MALREIAQSVWRLGAGRPRVVIMGGVHGNERTGVEVVQGLVRRFSDPSAAQAITTGELTLVIGNPPAVEQNVRFLDEDLNRCFGIVTPTRAAAKSTEQQPTAATTTSTPDAKREHKRAIELAPFLTDIDVLVDLHATNKPSQPFVRLPGSLNARFFARTRKLFLNALPASCETVLWDPHCLIGKGFMSDEFAMRRSSRKARGAFICYEAGLASDVTAVPATNHAVDMLLRRTGLLQAGSASESTSLTESSQRPWTHYCIAETLVLDKRGFEWVNGFGAENFQRVPAREVFARRVDGGEELRHPEESFIVFPKIEALWGLGKPLGWLATRARLLDE